MSNRKNIQDWVDDNFDYSLYDDFEDLYNDIDTQFLSDNRNGLDDVLLDEISDFKDFLAERIEKPLPFEQPQIPQEEPLFLPTEEPFEEPEPEEELTIGESIASGVRAIGRSIRNLFRF